MAALSARLAIKPTSAVIVRDAAITHRSGRRQLDLANAPASTRIDCHDLMGGYAERIASPVDDPTVVDYAARLRRPPTDCTA